MTNNPFKIYKDKYLWYCKICWSSGVLATNPDTVNLSIRKTAYHIHGLTNINQCKAKLGSIVVHKHTTIKKK